MTDYDFWTCDVCNRILRARYDSKNTIKVERSTKHVGYGQYVRMVDTLIVCDRCHRDLTREQR